MKKIIAKSLVFLFPLFLLSSQAGADIDVSAVFSTDEITIIAAWYQDHDTGSAQGHGKKQPKALPPGIEKNLARGKPLPPGIAKQVLPQGLIALLPSPPHGFERIIVDGKVLLVEVATNVIHDILTDVILR